MVTSKESFGSVVKSMDMKMNLNMGTFSEVGLMSKAHGRFIFDMRDAATGDRLVYWEKDNVLTLDSGILAARLFRNSLEPVLGASANKGLTMLTIGTGATGNLLSPDAPQPTQRRLNVQACRKPFSSAQFRDEDGVAVSYPTHIVDFTTTFSESEAVGPLNEMSVISAYSPDVLATNWVAPGAYDPTVNVSANDLMANYVTFGVVTKPATAILTITWRLSF